MNTNETIEEHLRRSSFNDPAVKDTLQHVLELAHQEGLKKEAVEVAKLFRNLSSQLHARLILDAFSEEEDATTSPAAADTRPS